MLRLTARWGLRVLLAVACACALCFFVHTGCSSYERPDSGTTRHAARVVGAQLRVLAFNVAKFGAHRGGATFASPHDVRAKMQVLADAILEHQAELVFLSEVLRECAPCPVDQVSELAELAEMHAWVFGENYNWGLPGYAIRGGNAILSRTPLRGERVEQLVANARPFWSPTGNRRVLWARVQIAESWLRVASVRNDSFDLGANLEHAKQIVAGLGVEAALLAGDFNAQAQDPAMRMLAESGRFVFGTTSGPTYPSRAPRLRIDYVLAPKAWRLVSDEVLEIAAISDHLAVLSVFEIPKR